MTLSSSLPYLAVAILTVTSLVTANDSHNQLQQQLLACLEKCLEPMLKLERSVSYVYRNYESVCDTLDNAGRCAETCSNEDKAKFYQYTTFYRIHCLDFEEEVEEHINCLSEASYKADVVCRGQCLDKTEDKRASKAEKQKSVCKSVECNTVCFVKELSAACRPASDMLMRLNTQIVEESRRITHPSAFDALDEQCRRVHDPEYMRERMASAVATAAIRRHSNEIN